MLSRQLLPQKQQQQQAWVRAVAAVNGPNADAAAPPIWELLLSLLRSSFLTWELGQSGAGVSLGVARLPRVWLPSAVVAEGGAVEAGAVVAAALVVLVVVVVVVVVVVYPHVLPSLMS